MEDRSQEGDFKSGTGQAELIRDQDSDQSKPQTQLVTDPHQLWSNSFNCAFHLGLAASVPADTVEPFSAAHLVVPSVAKHTVTFFKTAEGAVKTVDLSGFQEKGHGNLGVAFRWHQAH